MEKVNDWQFFWNDELPKNDNGMKIFAKPKQEVRDEQVEVGKSDESKGTSESEGITVFKDERKRKGSVPNKSKDRNASEHR